MKKLSFLFLLLVMFSCNQEDPIVHPLVGDIYEVYDINQLPDVLLYNWEFLEDGTVKIFIHESGLLWNASEFELLGYKGQEAIEMKTPVFGIKTFYYYPNNDGSWYFEDVETGEEYLLIPK